MGGRCREGTTTAAAARSSKSNQPKGGTEVRMMTLPSEVEIEEFFTVMERGRTQRLKDKLSSRYNYDFERDEPMDGRFEWVEIQAGDEGRN